MIAHKYAANFALCYRVKQMFRYKEIIQPCVRFMKITEECICFRRGVKCTSTKAISLHIEASTLHSIPQTLKCFCSKINRIAWRSINIHKSHIVRGGMEIQWYSRANQSKSATFCTDIAEGVL